MLTFAWVVALSPTIWSISSASQLFSQFKPCPDICSVSGPDPSNWTVIHDIQKLNRCKETTIFDLNIYNNITNPATHTTIRACTVDNASTSIAKTTAPNPQCGNFTATNASVEVTWSGNSASLTQTRLDQLLGPIQSQLENGNPICGSKVFFSQVNDTIVGVYAGGSVDASSSIGSLLTPLSNQAVNHGLGSIAIAQHCGDGIDGNHTVGVVISTDGDLALAQTVLQTWSNATCFNSLDSSSTSSPVAIFTKPLVRPRALATRGTTCSTVQVVSGDSCASLATECGISGAEFTMFNPSPTLCSTLAVGEFVCCSAGSLPNFAPQPGPDGACFEYTVQAGDFCDSIAEAHFITSTDIMNFNNNTWGWQGCTDVQLGQIICLSTGTPPFPAPVTNAVCGPQVPGTKPPSNFATLADLNPCPLNSCCDIFGQCGITPEFCTVSPSLTGAPGTSAPGTAGCISNCGFGIVNNSTGPSSFMKIGYWEAFNSQRPCLTMSASQIPAGFTHIHYSFSEITPDFQVDNSATPAAFQDFVATTGFKKIVSFGGWSFSTDEDSAPIFGASVSAANRETFAQSIVNLINNNNLDGIDFDWEYPDAPAGPGVPQGSPTDGPNYLAFLKTLRSMLPAGKTLSITAPSSFLYVPEVWPLESFPIAEMEPVVDYIVYLTYDLHGQWDYANQFTNPGCPTGNCLRSHFENSLAEQALTGYSINLTETEFALSMITKAGVPTNKIAVGVSSYGRSFGITTPGCTGVECFFDGPSSDALPGPCTQTPGILADAEIQALISIGGVQTRDEPSDSDIVVYANTWVAYMTPTTKASRTAFYQSLNFAGTADWAIDLESGDVTGNFGNTTGTDDQDNPTPTDVPIIPLTCTSLAPSATFTLTAACATEIAGLPVMSNNNDPPGPSPCTESCDLLREITGTCCGSGGSIANPVALIPGVQLPLPLPLPASYMPTANLTIPAMTLQPGEPAPVSFQLPAGYQCPTSITIPGGMFPPGLPIGMPVVLQPGYTPVDTLNIGTDTFPAGVSITGTVSVSASFVPPGPDSFIVPPFDCSPGQTLNGSVVISAGFTSPVPFMIPPRTFPPDFPLPPGIIFPTGFPIPVPIVLPPGPLPPDMIRPPNLPGGGASSGGEDEVDIPSTDPDVPPIIDPTRTPVPDPTTPVSSSTTTTKTTSSPTSPQPPLPTITNCVSACVQGITWCCGMSGTLQSNCFSQLDGACVSSSSSACSDTSAANTSACEEVCGLFPGQGPNTPDLSGSQQQEIFQQIQSTFHFPGTEQTS
ncbi:hypothetical protein F5884DRAFT_752191 [Xylogone sp. PMI_703]|nr:hypothetical protein F5884DRAFT_752191 [Xylogone sp. PMI_703]